MCAGERLLGTIVSPFSGDVLSEVRSPVDGILFTLREYPLVYEGSLMARVMARQGRPVMKRNLLCMTAPVREGFDIPCHEIGPKIIPSGRRPGGRAAR